MSADDIDRASPYLMAEPPTSPGRALLSRAFEHYCALQFGHMGAEIDAAFDGRGGDDVISEVAWSSRLLGEVIARGDVRTWARPIGGGEPIKLNTNVWELDDYRERFASSAINVAEPFASKARLTHWIFVDLTDWNRVIEASLGIESDDATPTGKVTAQAVTGTARSPASSKRSDAADEVHGRLVRLQEVLVRTSLSKATIYRRMCAGRFPRNVNQPGDVAVWREREVDDWIATPR